MQKVLIIEDESLIAKMIAEQFSKAEFQPFIAHDGISGYQMFDTVSPAIIILDLMLPYMDGFSVCRKIRKKSNVPVIMLTARTDVEDLLMGYEAKIDDYMTKPFYPEILVAKAKALLRLANHDPVNGAVLHYHGLMIDPYAHRVQVDGNDVDLEPKQYDLLLLLMQNKNIVMSREKLLNAIWGYDFLGNERVIDSHIKKLRKQLQYKAYMIVTVPGSGYRFEVR